MTGQRRWRPTRRRVTDSLIAALAPVAACGVALGGLTTWVAQDHAGSPARIAVTGGRVFLSFSSTRETSAFFRITNSGGADDRLVKVTSSATGSDATLSNHRMAGARAAYGQTVDSATVPAGAGLAMSPFGTDVTVRAKETWREGDLVPFTLHFAHSGRIRTLAVVVRPGTGGV